MITLTTEYKKDAVIKTLQVVDGDRQAVCSMAWTPGEEPGTWNTLGSCFSTYYEEQAKQLGWPEDDINQMCDLLDEIDFGSTDTAVADMIAILEENRYLEDILQAIVKERGEL